MEQLSPEVQKILDKPPELIPPSEFKPIPASYPKEPPPTLPQLFKYAILALCAILILGILIWIAAMTQALTNQAAINENTKNSILTLSNSIDARFTGLAAGMNQKYASLETRTGKLEKNPANLSDIYGRLGTIEASISLYKSEQNASLDKLRTDLDVANRQIGVLLAAQNGSGNALILNSSGNLTTSRPPPEFALRYQNLSCYWELRQTFGRYLDPEWLCQGGQSIPEYSGWVEPSCKCAAESCQYEPNITKKAICEEYYGGWLQ